MFQFDITVPSFSYPWTISLNERLSLLLQGKKKVAYYYEEANNSTFRYRAYNMAQVLNTLSNKEISASYFFASDLHRIDEIVNYADILVICRSGYNHHINHLITKFHKLGKRVLFDVDDLVFDTQYAHLIINSLDQKLNNPAVWDYWFAYISRMGATLRLCDGAITTNPYLAEKIFQFSNLPVKVIPNFINQEQLNLSDTLFNAKNNSNFARNDKICLGYFSGSPSHNLDYAIVSSVLAEVLAANPQVEIMIVGYIEAGAALKKFADRVIYQPFQDYVNLQKLIASVEFNLMPLQYNVFTNCKSELKYFEAAIVGTLSIASPAYTYQKAIQHGKNSYIAQAHQWFSVIQQAIDNIDHYADRATFAKQDAYTKYAWLNQYQTIVDALEL